jgi:nitrogen fixation protein NifQ
VQAADIYFWLMRARDPNSCDGFDAHIIASTLSLAIVEAAQEGRPLVACVGLDAPELTAMVAEMFPHAAELLARIVSGGGEAGPISEVEACLRELLVLHATSGTPIERRLAAIVARRAQRPHHLWQALGLRHRRELSWLMTRHFETIAARNSRDMRWKKFLYRAICRDEGFMICPAPSCSECSDLDACFGDEAGMSLLAGAPAGGAASGVDMSQSRRTSQTQRDGSG